jgi:hypothetical protein
VIGDDFVLGLVLTSLFEFLFFSAQPSEPLSRRHAAAEAGLTGLDLGPNFRFEPYFRQRHITR